MPKTVRGWAVDKFVNSRRLHRSYFLERRFGPATLSGADPDQQARKAGLYNYFRVGDDLTICGLSLDAGGGTTGRRANATIRIGRVASVKKLRVTGCW